MAYSLFSVLLCQYRAAQRTMSGAAHQRSGAIQNQGHGAITQNGGARNVGALRKFNSGSWLTT